MFISLFFFNLFCLFRFNKYKKEEEIDRMERLTKKENIS
jgi:hypothetical protein